MCDWSSDVCSSGLGNGTNAIALSGSLTGTTILPNSPGLAYVEFNNLSVNNLTLQPGAVMKFDCSCSPWAAIGLYISGVLNAQGTAGSPIAFTSLRDDAF